MLGAQPIVGSNYDVSYNLKIVEDILYDYLCRNLKYKTMSDKLLYIPNNNNLSLVVEMIGHSTQVVQANEYENVIIKLGEKCN